jgi:hypothetical protein
MKGENLEKWEPILGLPKKLYLDGLSDGENGLCLKFVGEVDSPVLLVNFESALSYRNTDEGDRLKFLNELSGQLEWSLYFVRGSEYLSWFSDQSYSIRDSECIKHYLFFTPNDIVEVLSAEDPVVKYK